MPPRPARALAARGVERAEEALLRVRIAVRLAREHRLLDRGARRTAVDLLLVPLEERQPVAARPAAIDDRGEAAIRVLAHDALQRLLARRPRIDAGIERRGIAGWRWCTADRLPAFVLAAATCD